MKIIDDNVLKQNFKEEGLITGYRNAQRGMGAKEVEHNFAADLLCLPKSLCFALDNLLLENPKAGPQEFDSIPFFSLLYGLFLPLTNMSSARVSQLFYMRWQESSKNNSEIIQEFLEKDIGLSLYEKILYITGDPFAGENSRIGQETLLQVLASIRLTSKTQLRDRLTRVGDIGILFVEEVSTIKSDPPITAKEVLFCLRGLPNVGTNRRKEILRDLFLRAGKLERYYLARLILRRLNLGYEHRSSVIHAAIAQQYNAPIQVVDNAIALSDIFTVCTIIEEKGVAGLAELVLKPLSPVSPALASIGEVGKNTQFPMWVECKYDGIRLMLHKETNFYGRIKYAAFTRRKNNWIEMVPGLENSLKWIPARSFIFDGELCGRIRDFERGHVRPATVYEVYKYLQGDSMHVMQLYCVIFDVLFLDGKEIIEYPFFQRRQIIERMIVPITGHNIAVSLNVSEGWEVKNLREFNKWYHNFQGQGYEGAMGKTLQHVYQLGKRTNDWMKKKPEITLDLVITGAAWSTTERGPQIFSTFEISCMTPEGFHPVGRAQGLSYKENLEIAQRITMEGLFTGRTIELETSTGIRQGIALIPSLVVTIRFEGVVRDSEGVYSLRDPKIVYIRPRGDLHPEEADTYAMIEHLFVKERLR